MDSADLDSLAHTVRTRIVARESRIGLLHELQETHMSLEAFLLQREQESPSDPREYTDREHFIITAHCHWMCYTLARAWISTEDLYMVGRDPSHAEHTRKYGIWFRFDSREEQMGIQFCLASPQDLWESKDWASCSWRWQWLALYGPGKHETHTLLLRDTMGSLDRMLRGIEAFFI